MFLNREKQIVQITFTGICDTKLKAEHFFNTAFIKITKKPAGKVASSCRNESIERPADEQKLKLSRILAIPEFGPDQSHYRTVWPPM